MARGNVDPSGDRDTLILGSGAVLLAVVAVGGVWVGQHLAAWLHGWPAPSSNPLQLFADTVRGRQPWPGLASGVVGVLGVVLLTIAVLAVIFWPRRRKLRPDKAARHMARPTDLTHLTAAGATSKARQLGAFSTLPGLPIGRTVRGGRQLFSSWEDMLILIAGPRIGWKTSAWAAPAILGAPGAVLATSNKPDLFTVTREVRARRGRVWAFDPQYIAGHDEPSWWWNPLSFICPPHPDSWHESESAATRLAAQLVTSARPPGAKVDPYWDGQAEHLIGLLLLAAALAGRPITQAYVWLTESTSEDAAEVLRARGYDLQADSAYSMAHLPDKQRAGVFDTARASLSFLTSRSVQRWVTPAAGREEFNPVTFARSNDTLYAMSKDGDASAGPLVAALTMAVFDALEGFAGHLPGARLAVPFVGVLDEAANIARVRNLDGLYSHYGSRGIILLTILQSWSQGVDVWGQHGMAKLWSAANHRVYAGGVDDSEFLTRLSRQIGTAELVQRTHSRNRSGRSVSRQVHERVILTSAELGELPPGRAVLFSSGSPAVLVETRRWFENRQTAELVAKARQA
jgi:type IV secretory pathway TraG/TraD family ATPase VirD4